MYNDSSTVSLGEWKGIKSAARGGLLKSLMIGQSPPSSATVAELVSMFSLSLVSSFLPGLPLFLTLE